MHFNFRFSFLACQRAS